VAASHIKTNRGTVIFTLLHTKLSQFLESVSVAQTATHRWQAKDLRQRTTNHTALTVLVNYLLRDVAHV
jgi:hypothetical protein